MRVTALPFRFQIVRALGLLALVALCVSAASPVRAQGQVDRNHQPSLERGDPFAREKSDIDGNNVRTSIFNTGMTGRTGAVPGEVPYEWPKNTRRHYIALTGLFVGAQVEAVSGATTYIVDLPRYRSDPNDDSRSWTFEPVAGYANSQSESIARSDDPDTWPDFWPDKLEDTADPGWRGAWSGFFGKDVFNADQELYYKMSDDQYSRYLDNRYFPDSTDHSRGGLGILSETRVLAWSQVLINDVVFVIHEVKNDGTEDLARTGVTLWLADLVGGDGDTSDDEPFYDLLEDVAFMSDRDGRGNEAFEGVNVGAAVATFLETPGNALDRIDNDGDGTTNIAIGEVGEENSPVITADLITGEDATNGRDDNDNGLIDENETYVPQGAPGSPDFQRGVGYADFIDNDADGEENGPIVTTEMVAQASGDRWKRWPANPESDSFLDPFRNLPGFSRVMVHLLMVEAEDVGQGYRDGIDNDDSHVTPTGRYPYLSEPGSPTITQEIVDGAASDPYRRHVVYRNGGGVLCTILYDVSAEDLGKAYRDCVDNDGDGSIDEGIDEGIDEMTDESRADGIDNDGDWRPGLDDVGLDGADFSSDPGEGDGLPSSGAGTELPGEPNVDKTDVSESDQIGITNVQYDPAGAINFGRVQDQVLFNDFMVPGKFFDRSAIEGGGDFDLFVSSGLFPLAAGQTERISYAVALGEVDYTAGPADLQRRYRDVLAKRDNALNAYLADYRFAQAPLAPTVTVVPGNGRVTLYWDTASENSRDSFLEDIGLPALDFEGYRVYRATDPAFLDAKVITDGFGNQQFLRPIAQFDLVNQYEGFHPVAVNGTQFNLGNNLRDAGEAANGLAHVFVDSTVTNGVTYYYAVTAYDHGAISANISPSESPIRIRFEQDGSVTTGRNVVSVTPTSSAAGMMVGGLQTGEDGFLPRVQGFTTSRIGYEVVDPMALRDGARYRIVFEDTLRSGGSNAVDTLTTKSFSLFDITDPNNPQPLISQSTGYRSVNGVPVEEAPVVDGFRLRFFSDPFVEIDPTQTSWNNEGIYPIVFAPYIAPSFVRGLRNPADYRIEIGGSGFGRSIAREVERGTVVPARDTNVRVFNETTGEQVDYVFIDLVDGTGNGNPLGTTPALFEVKRTAPARSDRILLIETLPNGQEGFTWEVSLNFAVADQRNPQEGDVLQVVTRKPFLERDVFEFTSSAPKLDPDSARSQLENIRVVPNPYRGASLFEGVNPLQTGRGERQIRFINLPPRCTIRIFTVSGHLVRTLEHGVGQSNEGLTAEALMNGEEPWDLESEDNLTVAYGIYLYHITAPGIGEKTGTLALIK